MNELEGNSDGIWTRWRFEKEAEAKGIEQKENKIDVFERWMPQFQSLLCFTLI